MSILWNIERAQLTQADMVVTLDALKRHLWTVGIDADDDYIVELCLSAMSLIEEQTNTSLVAREHTMTIDRFPYFWSSMQQLVPMTTGIMLPVWPLQSLTSLTYQQSPGVPVSIDVNTLQMRKYKPPSIFPAASNVWPFVNPLQVSSVEIVFEAGYADADAVPPMLKHAIRLLVGHWYKNREPAHQALLQAMPYGIDELIRTHKWWW